MTDNARMAKAKRGYSRAFKPRIRTPESRRRIQVDWVPPTLYDRVLAKCKRTGTSVRAVVLGLLSDWLKTDDEPPK